MELLDTFNKRFGFKAVTKTDLQDLGHEIQKLRETSDYFRERSETFAQVWKEQKEKPTRALDINTTAFIAVVSEKMLSNKFRRIFEELETLGTKVRFSDLRVPTIMSRLRAEIMKALNFSENENPINQIVKNSIEPGIQGAMRYLGLAISYCRQQGQDSFEYFKKASKGAMALVKDTVTMPNVLASCFQVGFLGLLEELFSPTFTNLNIKDKGNKFKFSLETKRIGKFIDDFAKALQTNTRELFQRRNGLFNFGCPAQFGQVKLPMQTDKGPEEQTISLTEALYMLCVDFYSQIHFGKRVFTAPTQS